MAPDPPRDRTPERDHGEPPDADARWLSTADAAERLQVKPTTLYAYVSRGLIASHRVPGRRGSVFHRDDVELLAARGRPVSEHAGHELVVHSAITELGGGRLGYRGHDATRLMAGHRFEAVAELLWTGELTDREPWRASPTAVRAARRAQKALPAASSALDRLRLIAAVAPTTDALRGSLGAEAVTAVGRQLIATLVEALPPAGGGAASSGAADGIAERLWTRLSERRPTRALVGTLDTALILLADHELAVSTLAARVAASARCDPYVVVECGLAAVSGALHGASTMAVERLLEGNDPALARQRIAHHLRDHGWLPGFGHFAYPEGDPRAVALLRTLRRTPGVAGRFTVAEAVIEAAGERGLPPPNVDFALAAFTTAVGMPIGSAEAIFAVARCAGWIAHALEQYAEGQLIRPRAIYTGPPTRPPVHPATRPSTGPAAGSPAAEPAISRGTRAARRPR